MSRPPAKRQVLRPAPRPGLELAPREKIIGSEPSENGVEGEGVEDGEGGSDGAEASGLEKIETGVSVEEGDERGWEADVRVGPAGTLLPERAEKYVLAMADGFSKSEAWTVIGGGAPSYAKRLRSHPVFRARLEQLLRERDKLTDEDDGGVGEAIWAVKQNWRIARAGGDVGQIHRATVLMVDTVKSFAGVGAPASEGSAPAGEAKGPGRPPHQPRATRPELSSMQATLKGIGRKPASEET